MKKTLIAIGALSVLFTASCKQVKSVNYNQTIVNMYNSYSNRLNTDLSIMAGTDDAARKTAAADAMDKLTDSCTTVMHDLKPVEEAKDFHNKVLAVYGAVKTDLVPLSRKIATIGKPEDHVDEYNKLVEDLNTTTTKLQNLQTEAQAAQAVFASKVNMKIQ